MHQRVDLQRNLLLPRQLVEVAQMGLVVQAVDEDLPGHPPQEHAGGLPDAGLDEVAVPDAEGPADLRHLLCRCQVRLRAGRRRGLPGGLEVGLDLVDELVRQVPVLPLIVEHRTVKVLGAPVSLTPKEFDILAFLATNRGTVFSKEEIYRAVWRDEYLLDDSNIMAFVRKIRKKIEPEPDNPRYLLTVWGVGYKMTE